MISGPGSLSWRTTSLSSSRRFALTVRRVGIAGAAADEVDGAGVGLDIGS